MVYTDGIMALSEPEYGDDADIAVINGNSVKIDDHMTNAFNNLAEPFNPNKAYEVGEIVVYEKVTYIFTAAKSAGAWDATKVEVKPLGTAIFEKEGGGDSLSDLTDTDIDSPVEGEVLTWDGTAWVNAEGTPAVTKTATGNPIEITDGADAPLVKCTTAIQGNQDLHGYDKPWVGGAGKNKLEVTTMTRTVNGVTFTVNEDGSINANGTASANIFLSVNPNISLASGQYVLSGCPSGGGSTSYRLYTQDPQGGHLSPDDGSSKSFSYDGTYTLQSFIVIYNGVSVNNLIFYPMIRLSTVTDPTFAPYSNICPITAYTEGEIEVRGKNVLPYTLESLKTDNTNGTWSGNTYSFHNVSFKINTDEKGNVIGIETSGTANANTTFYVMKDSNGSEFNGMTLNGCTNGSPNTYYIAFGENSSPYREFIDTGSGVDISGLDEKVGWRFYIFIANGKSANTTFYPMLRVSTDTDPTYEPYTSTTHTTTYPSAIYRGSEDVVNGTVTTEWGMIASYAGETLSGEWISDRDEYAPGTTPTTGAQVAYELATPTTSSVTPTNLPIKSLFGYNHIESSTGDMEVEYITQGYQPIVDLIQSSQHVYSTQEQVVGKWVDGKPIYEITFVLQSEVALTVNQWNSITGVSLSGVETPIAAEIRGSRGISVANVDFMDSPISVWGTTGTEKVKSITLRYTKTTATTRSLSKGSTEGLKAEISAEKSEGEELPTTDETTVKEAQSEDTETKEEAETEGNADEVQNETVTE